MIVEDECQYNVKYTVALKIIVKEMEYVLTQIYTERNKKLPLQKNILILL